MRAEQTELKTTLADDGKTASIEMLVAGAQVGCINLKAADLDYLIGALSRIRGGMTEPENSN